MADIDAPREYDPGEPVGRNCPEYGKKATLVEFWITRNGESI